MLQKKYNKYKSFEDFWPFYLSQHEHPLNRKLHLFGMLVGMISFVISILTRRYELMFLFPVIAYGHAWIGHFLIEKNKPATFSYPIWSLRGDIKMTWLMLLRKIK